jgi:hypothetical protein
MCCAYFFSTEKHKILLLVPQNTTKRKMNTSLFTKKLSALVSRISAIPKSSVFLDAKIYEAVPELTFSRQSFEHLEKLNLEYILGDELHLYPAFSQNPLTELYHSLMRPFKEHQFSTITWRKIEVIELQAHHKSLQKQVGNLINWAYNRRYKVFDGKYIPLDLPPLDEDTKTFVSVLHTDAGPVVLSCMSVVKGDGIEIFELFELPDHQGNLESSVEMKRYAKHPVLDLLMRSPDKELASLSKIYAQLSIREIWKKMAQHMTKNSLTPFYILAPHVKEWFEASGIGPHKEVSFTAKKESLKYQELLQLFPHYWQKNPAVYHAPTHPQQVTVDLLSEEKTAPILLK